MAQQTNKPPVSFDALMNSVCSVLVPVGLDPTGSEPHDAYGQPLQPFDSPCTGVPCRLSTGGGGHEWQSNKSYASNTFKVFLRPITKDDAGNDFSLSAKHWLQVTDQNGNVYQLNIKSVNDPSLLGHHLECEAEQIIA